MSSLQKKAPFVRWGSGFLGFRVSGFVEGLGFWGQGFGFPFEARASNTLKSLYALPQPISSPALETLLGGS